MTASASPIPRSCSGLTYGGGPLPFKMKAPQQKLPLPYQIPALLFEAAAPVPAPAPAPAPVTLPFDVGALDNDALALALKNANTSADGSIWIMTSQEKDALVHQVLDRLASGPISGTEEIVKHLLIPHLIRQLREPDADGRAPSVLRQHALPLLEKLRDEMLQCRRDGIQPPTCWDILVLPLLIESENARTPGLDVRLVTPDELGKELGDDARAKNTTGAIFIIDIADREHRTAAHGMTLPGSPPRVVVLDSIYDPTDFLKSVQLSDALLKSKGGAVPVTLQTQKQRGCSIFALSVAKKIMDHRDAVKALYAGLDGAGAVDRPEFGIQERRFGKDIPLPTAFFKHSQSRKPLEALPANARQETINKKNENALSRWNRHQVTRMRSPTDPPDAPRVTYSASVEIKRLEFVQESIRHFRKQ